MPAPITQACALPLVMMMVGMVHLDHIYLMFIFFHCSDANNSGSLDLHECIRALNDYLPGYGSCL